MIILLVGSGATTGQSHMIGMVVILVSIMIKVLALQPITIMFFGTVATSDSFNQPYMVE